MPSSTPPAPSGAQALAQHLEDSDATPDESKRDEHVDSPFESVPAFLVGLLLRFGFTIAALKLAFKYWEMDAFWNGILKIAGIDLGIHTLCELLGPLSGGFTTMGAVENGTAGLVLIYTINRFCFNKRIQNAVATAAAVKVVVTLCYIFGALVLLNSAFG